MNFNILKFIGFLLTFVLISDTLCADDAARVRYVVDGDTVILQSGEHIRYIGIDAPEIDRDNKPAEPFSHAARALNKAMVGLLFVHLEFDHEKRDHYNRLLAYVFLPDRTFVNLELLRSGMATYLHKPPNLKYADTLVAAQQEAMAAHKGLWESWSEQSRTYVGNRKSKRFHLPGCGYGKKTAAANRVAFSKQWDAYWQGYAPCKKCVNLK